MIVCAIDHNYHNIYFIPPKIRFLERQKKRINNDIIQKFVSDIDASH